MNSCENERSPCPGRGDFIVMIGLPGAGKSTQLKATFGDTVTVLNSDHVMRTLPGAADIIAEGDPDEMTALHLESVRILNDMMTEALKGFGPIAYDSTGLGGKGIREVATLG